LSFLNHNVLFRQHEFRMKMYDASQGRHYFYCTSSQQSDWALPDDIVRQMERVTILAQPEPEPVYEAPTQVPAVPSSASAAATLIDCSDWQEIFDAVCDVVELRGQHLRLAFILYCVA
jgi:hypothetical protein